MFSFKKKCVLLSVNVRNWIEIYCVGVVQVAVNSSSSRSVSVGIGGLFLENQRRDSNTTTEFTKTNSLFRCIKAAYEMPLNLHN